MFYQVTYYLLSFYMNCGSVLWSCAYFFDPHKPNTNSSGVSNIYLKALAHRFVSSIITERLDMWCYIQTYLCSKHLSGIFPLCKGMPVMITHNYDVQNGIVNRHLGILEKINFTFDNNGYRHAWSRIVHTKNQLGPPLPHLQNGEVVILQDDVSLTFTHPHSHMHSSFWRTQLPLTPAFAQTAHM